MADNWLEKKFEDLRTGKTASGRRDSALKKRLDAARKSLEEERSSAVSYSFDVAGHVFAVILPESLVYEEVLSPYMPFASSGDDVPLFTLRLEPVSSLDAVSYGRKKECFNDEPPYFWMFEKFGRYNFGFSYTKEKPDCILVPSLGYTSNTLYVPREMMGKHASFALSNALMLLYAFKTIGLDTLLVHASVIAHEGAAHMFLGRSGTGKSTHSRLWLKYVKGTHLLNDDNPVVRIIDGEVYVYGSPWSGKTPCYRNERFPLKSVVRLSQAPYNRIERLSPLKSYASLMPSCSCMRWDREAMDSLHSAVGKVVTEVPGWHLECLPDQDASRVCHDAVNS